MRHAIPPRRSATGRPPRRRRAPMPAPPRLSAHPKRGRTPGRSWPRPLGLRIRSTSPHHPFRSIVRLGFHRLGFHRLTASHVLLTRLAPPTDRLTVVTSTMGLSSWYGRCWEGPVADGAVPENRRPTFA